MEKALNPSEKIIIDFVSNKNTRIPNSYHSFEEGSVRTPSFSIANRYEGDGISDTVEIVVGSASFMLGRIRYEGC